MNPPYIPFDQFQEVEPGISIAFALSWGDGTQYPMATQFDQVKDKHGDALLRAKFLPDFEDFEVGSGLLILQNFTEERKKSGRDCETIYRISFYHDGSPELEVWGWRYEVLQAVETSYELTDTKSSPPKPLTPLQHYFSQPY